ncbi:unnamed protein product [Schistocephalus solidus]|uniref:DNA-directed RNA polymerase n=1 Tax=Schistocephalus solidus TaxID=70667 RepID=A0A183TH54_SCHSO|nr:unnamed protein product [Schistocephalus solidus]
MSTAARIHGRKDPIPLLRTAEGIDFTENEAKADHLSEFFQSVFSKETRYDYTTDGFEVDTIVETVQFTETTVLKELLGLKECKSPDPDEVPAKLLKVSERVSKTTLYAFPNILPDRKSTSQLDICMDYAA